MFSSLTNIFSNDIGIDLGSANVLLYVKDQGVVLREPSVVAVQTGTNEVIAFGDEAKRMMGRTPQNFTALRPLKNGIVSEPDLTEAMLNHYIDKAHPRRKVRKRRIVVAVPSGITELEKRVLREAVLRIGARDVYFIEQPMAAAIGMGLSVQDPAGNLLVDIGSNTTEIAIISLGGIVYCRSLRVAGDALDEALVAYVRRAFGIEIGERTAEEIKIRTGSAMPREKEVMMEFKGRDVTTGLPRTISITSQEVREALMGPLEEIVSAIFAAFQRCPPELSSDLVERGLILAGGGALLKGMDLFISQKINLPVHIADDPLSAVVEGTGRLLENPQNFSSLASIEKTWR